MQCDSNISCFVIQHIQCKMKLEGVERLSASVSNYENSPSTLSENQNFTRIVSFEFQLAG